MVKVLGIGGIFFRSENPAELAKWYQTHLGINLTPTTPEDLPWHTEAGVTVFSPFSRDTEYFAKDKMFMLNFRVADIAGAIADLTKAGISTSPLSEMEGIGKFVRIHDPEGNPIELWEQAPGGS